MWLKKSQCCFDPKRAGVPYFIQLSSNPDYDKITQATATKFGILRFYLGLILGNSLFYTPQLCIFVSCIMNTYIIVYCVNNMVIFAALCDVGSMVRDFFNATFSNLGKCLKIQNCSIIKIKILEKFKNRH